MRSLTRIAVLSVEPLSQRQQCCCDVFFGHNTSLYAIKFLIIQPYINVSRGSPDW